MNEITLSTDINIITAEINSYKNVAGQAIFEIGKRLKYVKENDLVHGEFGKWLETIDMIPRTAQQFIQIAEDFGSNANSISHLGFTKLLQISQLPQEVDRQEFISQSHTVPSTGEQKTVDEMTVRELREVKKALKEAEAQAEEAKRSEKIIKNKLERLENQPPEVIEKVVERVIQDETKINLLESQLNSKKNELNKIADENNRLKKTIQMVDVKKEDFNRLERNINELNAKKSNLQQDIEDIEEITKFIMKIEEITSKGLAPIMYSKAIRRQEGSIVVMERLNNAITSIEDWCQDIRKYTHKSNVIEMEVFE